MITPRALVVIVFPLASHGPWCGWALHSGAKTGRHCGAGPRRTPSSVCLGLTFGNDSGCMAEISCSTYREILCARSRLPLLILCGCDDFHPTPTSEEIAKLAPNAELIRSWKTPEAHECPRFFAQRRSR